MPVARTHEKALVRQVDFDLIAAEPLPEFADVFTLDQHTVFGKAGGQIVVREAGQGELMFRPHTSIWPSPTGLK